MQIKLVVVTLREFTLSLHCHSPSHQFSEKKKKKSSEAFELPFVLSATSTSRIITNFIDFHSKCFHNTGKTEHITAGHMNQSFFYYYSLL